MFQVIAIYIYMNQCIHCTVWQTATSRSLNDRHMNCHEIIIVYNHAAYIITFSCLLFIAPDQPAGGAEFQAVPHRPTLQIMENESNGKVPYGYNPFTLHVRKSCSSSTGRRDVYTIHSVLVYASTTIIPVPIRYACQFISFFQYIIIRVKQAKL